jgi:hypothetical protein
VPLEDFVAQVRGVLVRADSLFGTATLDSPIAHSQAQLSRSADAVRGTAAADMSGSAIAGYGKFAQQRASALARLADTEAQLNKVLQDAAVAETAAAASSRSTVDTATSRVNHLTATSDTAGGQRALVVAMHDEIGRQQDLVRRHQQHAVALAERVGLLTYD